MLEDLEKNIESLRRENEELQRKICYIYESSRNDREDRNNYKDTNILIKKFCSKTYPIHNGKNML